MDRHYILVRTEEQSLLEQAIMDFCNLYSDSKSAEWIRLFRRKKESDSFLVTFTTQPDFDFFSFCINYLVYPNDLQNLKTHVVGYFNSQLDRQLAKLVSGWVKVYIPKDDTQYDNVHFLTSNGESFINDFASGVKSLSRSNSNYSFVPIKMEDYHHISDYISSKIAKNNILENKPWWKFW